MLLSLRIFFWVVSCLPDLCPIPIFTPISPLFAQNYLATNFTVCYRVRGARMGWISGGSHGWCGFILGLVRKVKCAWNLTCQLDSWFRISVRISVMQGTGESISSNRTWVRSYNCDCDYIVYPPLYVWNGFFFSLTCFYSIAWVNLYML